jgi:hypothetical protein
VNAVRSPPPLPNQLCFQKFTATFCDKNRFLTIPLALVACRLNMNFEGLQPK